MHAGAPVVDVSEAHVEPPGADGLTGDGVLGRYDAGGLSAHPPRRRVLVPRADRVVHVGPTVVDEVAPVATVVAQVPREAARPAPPDVGRHVGHLGAPRRRRAVVAQPAPSHPPGVDVGPADVDPLVTEEVLARPHAGAPAVHLVPAAGRVPVATAQADTDAGPRCRSPVLLLSVSVLRGPGPGHWDRRGEPW